MLGSDRTRARVFATFSAYFTCNPGLGYVYVYIYIYVYVLSPPFSYIYMCVRMRSYYDRMDRMDRMSGNMSGIAHDT